MNATTIEGVEFQLVSTQTDLMAFAEAVQGCTWMAFDTEFIGEKRYYTLLCLIQVKCEAGIFLIDPLHIADLTPFLRLIEDPAICKITHAGDNDYRLLNMLYGTIPKQVFDTQIAAGFLGYRYPISFAKLVEEELGRPLAKGFGVTDWQQRPMKPNQLKYALEDVLYLKELHDRMIGKLEKNGRANWAAEECNEMASPDYYEKDPNYEFLHSRLVQTSRSKDQLFLLRLFEWRRQEAEQKNYSKEMILSSKIIGALTKAVRSGKEALYGDRRLPAKTIQRYGDHFLDLYQREATDTEKAILKSVPKTEREEEEDDMLLEFLYILMKYRCGEQDISHQLVMPRSALKRMKNDAQVRKSLLGSGWRRELMGDNFIHWLKDFDRLKLKIDGGHISMFFEDY